jgi:hypothetical protein
MKCSEFWNKAKANTKANSMTQGPASSRMMWSPRQLFKGPTLKSPPNPRVRHWAKWTCRISRSTQAYPMHSTMKIHKQSLSNKDLSWTCLKECVPFRRMSDPFITQGWVVTLRHRAQTGGPGVVKAIYCRALTTRSSKWCLQRRGGHPVSSLYHVACDQRYGVVLLGHLAL